MRRSSSPRCARSRCMAASPRTISAENVAALATGFANLARHLENLQQFGVPAVVAVNRFSADTEAEHDLLKQLCAAHGVEAVIADHWAKGGEGAEDLAQAVRQDASRPEPANFKPLYPDEMPLLDKIKTIATQDLRRGGHRARRRRSKRGSRSSRRRLRPFPGLHRQDAIQLLDRSRCQGRADGPHAPGARSAPVGGRGVRRRDLRRDHDHAGPAARAGGEQHHGFGRRENLGLVLRQGMRLTTLEIPFVIPAKAGIQGKRRALHLVPAFAGTTSNEDFGDE